MTVVIVENLTERTAPESMLFYDHTPGEFTPGDTFERWDCLYKIIAAAPINLERSVLK